MSKPQTSSSTDDKNDRLSNHMLITLNRTEYPSMDEMLEFTKKKLSPTRYAIVREYGKETNKEHYHIFVELQIPKRSDNVKRSYDRYYNSIFKENRDTNKTHVCTYKCPDVDPIQWGFGYCFKDQVSTKADGILTNCTEEFFEQCKIFYEENLPAVQKWLKEIRTTNKDALTVTQVCHDFVEWYISHPAYQAMQREYTVSDYDNSVFRAFLLEYERFDEMVPILHKIKIKDLIPYAEIKLERLRNKEAVS